jgi:pre-rRNA-processing protein TSR3
MTTQENNESSIESRLTPIFIYEMRQDDPRKCTSAKLVRFQIGRRILDARNFSKKAIVLNPTSETALIKQDYELPSRYGLIVIDCSWKRAGSVFHQYRFKGEQRSLPLLLAGNPVNYGRLAVLSSAEAIAAALYVFGDIPGATKVLSLFKWGQTFLDLNHEPLEEYKRAESREEIGEIEREFFPMAFAPQKPL